MQGGATRRGAGGALLAMAVLVASGCATYPAGPSMMVLPGTQAGFEQFRFDEANCRVYAEQSVGGVVPRSAAGTGAVDSAVAGTAVGAAAGALIGAAAGNPAAGAAIGGGSGLLLGAAAGSDAYAVSGGRTQASYDNAYVQCMYARGHQVPVPAALASVQPSPQPAAPALPSTPGPVPTYPPPGTAPPPGY